MDWRTHDDMTHRVTLDEPPLMIDAEVSFTISRQTGDARIDPITVGSLTFTRDDLIAMFGEQVQAAEDAAADTYACNRERAA